MQIATRDRCVNQLCERCNSSTTDSWLCRSKASLSPAESVRRFLYNRIRLKWTWPLLHTSRTADRPESEMKLFSNSRLDQTEDTPPPECFGLSNRSWRCRASMYVCASPSLQLPSFTCSQPEEISSLTLWQNNFSRRLTSACVKLRRYALASTSCGSYFNDLPIDAPVRLKVPPPVPSARRVLQPSARIAGEICSEDSPSPTAVF
mmetsp:Transcript_82133/g.214023  ORF Transcript_82133/g.214023 Transcript_82133/m.214023 type:complete len:205 (+) Transcript_82133:669-1283(+)